MDAAHASRSGVRARLALFLSAYAALGLYYLPDHRFEITPDATSYLAIAEKYLAGDFGHAVNSYWSPLLSWLLIPFIAVGVPGLLASKCLLLLVGAAAMVGMWRLSSVLQIPAVPRDILIVSLIPLCVYFALFRTTPDLLITTVLIFYFVAIFDPAYRTSPRSGWQCGVLGALAYFAKAFGFPFFLAHFLVFNGVHYLGGSTADERRTVLRNLASGLVIFAAASGAWIVAISLKYQTPTFSTAGGYTYQLKMVGYQHRYHLVPPPNATAISYWEDPYLSRRGTRDDRRPQRVLTVVVEDLRENTTRLFHAFQRFSPLSPVVLVAALAWLCLPGAKPAWHANRMLYLLLTLAIYSGGYVLILVEARYLWPDVLLLLLLGFALGALMFEANRARWWPPIAAGLLVLYGVSFWQFPLTYLQGSRGTGRRILAMSKTLQDRAPLSGNVASDTNWNDTLYLAYYDRFRYYGQTGQGEGGRPIEQDLQAFNIDYYVVWDPMSTFDARLQQLTPTEKGLPRIFRVQRP